jgi:hypothetical protein
MLVTKKQAEMNIEREMCLGICFLGYRVQRRKKDAKKAAQS